MHDSVCSAAVIDTIARVCNSLVLQLKELCKLRSLYELWGKFQTTIMVALAGVPLLHQAKLVVG